MARKNITPLGKDYGKGKDKTSSCLIDTLDQIWEKMIQPATQADNYQQFRKMHSFKDSVDKLYQTLLKTQRIDDKIMAHMYHYPFNSIIKHQCIHLLQ